MRVLIAVPVLLTACLTDPPYHPYSTQQHAQQGGPTAQGPYQDPNSPSGYSNHPTYQTNLNGPPPGPQPPPYVPPANGPGGVTVGPSAPGAPPQPMGGPTGVGPATGAPPPINASPTVAGRYQCWVAGAGMYAQSNLGLITLDFNNSYSSTQNTSTGTYRVDGMHVLFTGGPLAGYVGALESNSNGPLVRFHAELPSDPGSQLRVGDHVCYLTR
jgi:hypothetical protein